MGLSRSRRVIGPVSEDTSRRVVRNWRNMVRAAVVEPCGDRVTSAIGTYARRHDEVDVAHRSSRCPTSIKSMTPSIESMTPSIEEGQRGRWPDAAVTRSSPWQDPAGIALRAPLGHMRGDATKSMSHIDQVDDTIDRGGATWQMARCRRNPKGAGGFGSQTLSFVGHDVEPSLGSSLRA